MKYPELSSGAALGCAVFRSMSLSSPGGVYNVGKDSLPKTRMAAFFGRRAQAGLSIATDTTRI